MPILSAPLIYTPQGFVRDHVLVIADDGAIVALKPFVAGEFSPGQIVPFSGILFPGFVNAHCHLELSALQGKIPEGTGMTAFAGAVGAMRASMSGSEHHAAIAAAMHRAWDTGTVAMGDIANGLDSTAAKHASPIWVHTFFEAFGLREASALQALARCESMASAAKNASVTLHAPYSVLPAVRDRVYALAQAQGAMLSIHLLESKAEREIFALGTGELADFYRRIGVERPAFGTDSPIHYLLDACPRTLPLLLVHCTEMTAAELDRVMAEFPRAYICLNPRSNRYIHGTFPAVALFARYPTRICLGTDSLASNHSLDMGEELRAILSGVGPLDEKALHTAMRWATTGGAEALQVQGRFGSFRAGSHPGIMHWAIQGEVAANISEEALFSAPIVRVI